MNRVCLMGRLTHDVELRQTQSGTAVAAFSVAVTRKYDREKTDFIDAVAWRQTAEFVSKYFKRGDMIAIEGVMQTRTYEDKQGNKRKAVEVVTEQVYFCGSKQSTDRFGTEQSENTTQSSFSIDGYGDFEEVDTDDSKLPF